MQPTVRVPQQGYSPDVHTNATYHVRLVRPVVSGDEATETLIFWYTQKGDKFVLIIGFAQVQNQQNRGVPVLIAGGSGRAVNTARGSTELHRVQEV